MLPIRILCRPGLPLAMAAVLSLPAAAGTPADSEAGDPHLRVAKLVPVPVKRGSGRFRLAATLAPRRVDPVRGEAHRVVALLWPKADASCPVPAGTIFASGFEIP